MVVTGGGGDTGLGGVGGNGGTEIILKVYYTLICTCN